MIIDTHGHMIPPELLAATRKERPQLSAGLVLAFEHDLRVLRFVIEMMDAARAMLGSDMPFPIGDHEPMTIKNAGPRPDQVQANNGGTAQKPFRIN